MAARRQARALHAPHASGAPSPALRWSDYVTQLAERHGSLATLAMKLSLAEGSGPDSTTVERALRRLRNKDHEDGGQYGRLLLRTFGMPRDIELRAKWMGVYHSRFTDLPVSLCLDQLRLWDRPPLAESRTRTWLELGFATCALRQQDLERARLHLERARGGHGVTAARIEVRLLEAFVASRRGDRATAVAILDELEPSLHHADLETDERACLEARWIDQRAYQVLHPAAGELPDLEQAARLYSRIATREAPFFAACKRDGGLAYVAYRQGHHDEARTYAESASRHAGDGGFARLRVAALGLLAHVLGTEGDEVRARALRAARSLEDEDLVHRLQRTEREISPSPGRAPAGSGRPRRPREVAPPESAAPLPRTRKKRTPP